MLSRNANYDMDDALLELNKQRDLVNVAAETQTILQLLVHKGIVTRDEVSEMREKVRKSRKYRSLYDEIEQVEKKIIEYKENPQQHLKDLFAAKLNGTIK